MKAFALFLLCVSAQAQPCLPMQDTADWTGSPIYSGVTKNGAWVRWYCYGRAGDIRSVAYVGTVAELSKVGSRVQTIINSPDPLKSLQTAGSRYTILPLTDPSLSKIVADMEANK